MEQNILPPITKNLTEEDVEMIIEAKLYNFGSAFNLRPGGGLNLRELVMGTTITGLGKFRINMPGGTSIATSDVSLSAGWGASASVTAVTGNDSRGAITITTNAADTPTANPTATLTFKNGTWNTAPFAIANMQHASTGPSTVPVTCQTTATTLVISYRGTPTAVSALTYIFNYYVVG